MNLSEKIVQIAEKTSDNLQSIEGALDMVIALQEKLINSVGNSQEKEGAGVVQ